MKMRAGCCIGNSNTLCAWRMLSAVIVIFQNGGKLLVKIQTKPASIHPWFTRLKFLKNSVNTKMVEHTFCVYVYTNSDNYKHEYILHEHPVGMFRRLQDIEYFIICFARLSCIYFRVSSILQCQHNPYSCDNYKCPPTPNFPNALEWSNSMPI